MRMSVATLAALCTLAVSSAFAQDSAAVSPGINSVLVDNAHVRVVKSTFAPGQKEGTHTHPAGWYIVTKGGDLLITTAEGKTSH